MRIGIGLGIPFNRVYATGSGINPIAQAHYDRVIADGGVCTYGVVGVNTKLVEILTNYSVSDLTTLNIDAKWLDYFGYKSGSGSGTTAGRAIQKAYSILGANYDQVQNSTTAQPALSAWSVGQNFFANFGGTANGIWSGNRANTNNTKVTYIVRFRKQTSLNNFICGHGDNVATNSAILMTNSNQNPAFLFSDGTNSPSNATISTSFDGWLKVIVTTSGGNLLLNWSTSSDGITYTALGTQVTATGKAGLIGSTSRRFYVGGRSPFHGGQACEVLLAQVYDSTDALLFNFNPNDYNRSVSQTSWTATTTGEIYTLNNDTNATGLKAMIVDQTMAQGNGTSMGMQAASASLNSLVFTQYSVWRKYLNVITAGSSGILTEYGANVAVGQGMAFNPNDPASTESIYLTANGGLNGTSWQSTSTALKVSTFRGDVNGSPYEQTLATNNVNNTINAVQSPNNNTTAIVATGKNLLARNNAASLWLNAIWVGDLMTIQTDSSGQEAAIYNMFADGTNII